MRALVLLVLAASVALIDVSLRPWIPLIHAFSFIAAVPVVLLGQQPSGWAYIWCTIITVFLADSFLGAPLGIRPSLMLAALIVVQPWVRTFRQQRGLLPLAAIGIVLVIAERLGVILGHRPWAWGAWWASATFTWVAPIVWVIAVAYLASRGLRRNDILHATTPI